MNHPLPGFELNELTKIARRFQFGHTSTAQFALELNSFFATEYVIHSVMVAVADLLAGGKPSGDGW